MSEKEALAGQDLATPETLGDYQEPVDEWGDGDDWDDPPTLDDWDDYPEYGANSEYRGADQGAPPQVSAWFRNPRWLFGLIALAAAALVVATVLLVTGRGSGEMPTAPQLSTRTSPTTASTPASRSAPPPRATSSSTSTSPSTSPSDSTSESPAEEPAEEPGQEPALPAESAPPSATEPASSSASRSPAGPRINVTRTPMSFTPGRH